MESLAPILSWLVFPFGPVLVVAVLCLPILRIARRRTQSELEPLAHRFGLRPLVPPPGISGLLAKPGLVGRFEGQEVVLTITSETRWGASRRQSREEPSWGVHLRLRITPALSTEFSATREGVSERLLQRLVPEKTVGDEDLDALLHIRSLGVGDREVLRLQTIQNGIFRLGTLGRFEFHGGEMRVYATALHDWSDLAEELLLNAQNFAHALAHVSVPDPQHQDVWSV
ncbi:MAG TPA: hypothetical protein VK013_13205 [Myxococcaceae bacterium]|nr:hypothetical protein [Myxococcaceae bacterium]